MKVRQIARLTGSAVRAITSLLVLRMRGVFTAPWFGGLLRRSWGRNQEMFESVLRGSVSDDTIPPVKQPIYRRIFMQLKGP
jgi:hypothetical protein